jgi:hypothetical protein
VLALALIVVGLSTLGAAPQFARQPSPQEIHVAAVPTPTDMLVSPTPADTPVPPPSPITVTFSCLALFHSASDISGIYHATLCVSTAPTTLNQTLPCAIHYCAGQHDDGLSVALNASGAGKTQPILESFCPTPLTITFTATGTDGGGHPFKGSASATARMQ